MLWIEKSYSDDDLNYFTLLILYWSFFFSVVELIRNKCKFREQQTMKYALHII